MSNKVAIILSGCGVYDGSEIHETSAICVALTRFGKTPVFYAPDKQLFHEVNHTNGESGSTERNVLIEAGRIARGKVHNISSLNPETVEAIVFPGGFGAAKNLCTFAVSEDPEVESEISRIIKSFHESKKPIGMCCISPIIGALVLAKDCGIPIKITLGKQGDLWPYGNVIDKAIEFGADHEEKEVNEVCIDNENKLVTTPAFMYDGQFHEIFDGINNMIEELIKLIE